MVIETVLIESPVEGVTLTVSVAFAAAGYIEPLPHCHASVGASASMIGWMLTVTLAGADWLFSKSLAVTVIVFGTSDGGSTSGEGTEAVQTLVRAGSSVIE